MVGRSTLIKEQLNEQYTAQNKRRGVAWGAIEFSSTLAVGHIWSNKEKEFNEMDWYDCPA